MKKLRYSTGLKTTMVVVQQILFVILVTSILLVTTLFQKNILDFGDIRNQPFSSSAYFSSLFRESAEEVLNFVELRKKFETEGIYDTEKLIDIKKYYDSAGRLGEESKTKTADTALSRYYTLGDLVEWARDYSISEYEFVSSFYIEDGVIYQQQTITKGGSSVYDQDTTVESLGDMSAELQEMITSNVEYYYGGSYNVSYQEIGIFAAEEESADRTAATEEKAADRAATEEEEIADRTAAEEGGAYSEEERSNIIRKVINGGLYGLDSSELNFILTDMGMERSECVSIYNFIDEEYLSVDGRGIWNDFIQGKCTETQMCKAYEELGYTLENIGQEVNTYKKCLNRYNLGKEGSNVSYWIKRGSGDSIYTNLEDQNIDDLIEYGKEMGKYFFYREADMRLETNVKEMEDIFYDELELRYGGKDTILFFCVNMEFPQEDSFYEGMLEYERMYPWIYIGIISAVISGLGYLICFLYLSIVAGRKGEDKTPEICWFDKIPTEIAFIGAAACGIAAVVYYGEVLFRFSVSELAGFLIMAGVLAFFGSALFMLFYLSFVRRIRAGVLWSGSITHWIIRGIAAIFHVRKPATKMIIWFAVHLLACLVLSPLILEWNRGYQMIGAGCFIVLSVLEGILILREGSQRNQVLEGIRNISGGDLEFKIDTRELKGDNKTLAEAVNTVGDGLFHAVDDSMKNERLKADLITNVSHDIKTPLTSIVNYVDLLKREDIPNERAQNYIAVLEQKSQRLKQLTEDLLEASKISSGNITLQMERINFVELVYQTGGEFNEKFEAKGLTAVTKLPREAVVIMADGRRIWRVIENLYNNVAKYAMPNTRVYIDMETDGDRVSLSIKNISQNALNIQADELTERFIRGDVSRSTEGSGLGLSIAQNLTQLMGGEFEIYLDGDLFKVTISFIRELAREETVSEQKTEE